MDITDDQLRERAQNLLEAFNPRTVDQTTFRGAQFDAGLAWVQFPEGFGGLGLSLDRQALVDQVLRDGGSPYHNLNVNFIGIGIGAPTLLEYGDEALWENHLRPIFTGEDGWCQLYSEPSSGSDMAGIPGRAVRDGDDWIVNAQKVWTTLAHRARFGMLLIRTDPDVAKHAGLSYFIVDMQSPGIEVRPLFQLTGDAEFNEVWLTDVRVPHANILGRPGDGWKVMNTSLMNERLTFSGGSAGKGRGPIRVLRQAWTSRGGGLPPAQHAVMRDRVTDLIIRSEVLRLNNQRARQLAASGTPGRGFSLGKLMSGELNQEIFSTCVDLEGAQGMIHPEGYPMQRRDTPQKSGSATLRFLVSRSESIYGGTSEIQRNIIGEKILGLPPEPRLDKGIPWRDLPR